MVARESSRDRTSETNPVCLVHLVDLVHLVSFVQPKKPDKPNSGLLMYVGELFQHPAKTTLSGPSVRGSLTAGPFREYKTRHVL